MRATVDSAAFRDAVTRTIQATSKEPALPVLGGLLLEVRRGHLHVTGASSGTAGHVRVKVSSHRAGRALVDADRLAAIARNLPDTTVGLVTRRTAMVITSGPTTWTLLTMPDEDYPTWTDSVMAEHGNHADRAKPQGPSTWERKLGRAEREIRDILTPWKPSRTRALYAPAPFEVGDWVTVTTDTEVLVGQMAATNVVIWHNGDGTTCTEMICRESGGHRERWYVRRHDEDAQRRNELRFKETHDGSPPLESTWQNWDLRRTACPFEDEHVPEPDELAAATAAEADEGLMVYQLPDPFEWRWPDFDPEELAVTD
ncbi:hypothetical protein [Actinomadura litoris]|uniref:hypothetical protein n=1 Tax=Actinomadura litoris TaxID=2678616 RepID=UPI001FA7A732|nr:hypothetical protein [Actinomadura litoris]